MNAASVDTVLLPKVTVQAKTAILVTNNAIFALSTRNCFRIKISKVANKITKIKVTMVRTKNLQNDLQQYKQHIIYGEPIVNFQYVEDYPFDSNGPD